MDRCERYRHLTAWHVLFGAAVMLSGASGQGAIPGLNRQVAFLQTPSMWHQHQIHQHNPPWAQYSMPRKRSPEPPRPDMFYDPGLQQNPYSGPTQYQPYYNQQQRFSQVPDYDGRALYPFDQERSEVRNPDTGRLISNSALTKFSETLGALNTVGHYLVDKVSEKESKNDPDAQLAQIPHALLTISKNVLGRNVTDTIAPFVSLISPQKISQSDAPSNKVLAFTAAPTSKVQTLEAISASKVTTFGKEPIQESDTKSCTTPEGKPGVCDDLSNCPQLLLNLGNLRESLCFKSLFVPGVCCPSDSLSGSLQEKPAVAATNKPTYLVPVTTQRPTTKRPSPILVLTTRKPTTARPTTARPKTTTAASRPTTAKPVTSTFFTVPPPVIGNYSNIVNIDECGQREDESGRIVGGIEAKSGSWPWMAAIFLHGAKRREFWCGGSLVGPKHVLTAAHCTRDSKQRPFPARQFTVRLGDVDLASSTEPSRPMTARVTEVRAHEQFARVGFYNDIALLVLAEPVQKSKYVIPICLPGAHLARHQFDGATATVVGWGTTKYGGTESSQQLQAALPVWRNDDCDRAYFQPITENFICAGYTEGGTDACQGDSGGPLMLSVGGRWTQIGVVSFGNKCGEPGYPGVYTRLTHYRAWLDQNLKASS